MEGEKINGGTIFIRENMAKTCAGEKDNHVYVIYDIEVGGEKGTLIESVIFQFEGDQITGTSQVLKVAVTGEEETERTFQCGTLLLPTTN